MQLKLELDKQTEKEMAQLMAGIENITMQINAAMKERNKDIDHLNARWREACKDHILAGGQNFTKEQIVSFMLGNNVYVQLDNGVGAWEINVPEPSPAE